MDLGEPLDHPAVLLRPPRPRHARGRCPPGTTARGRAARRRPRRLPRRPRPGGRPRSPRPRRRGSLRRRRGPASRFCRASSRAWLTSAPRPIARAAAVRDRSRPSPPRPARRWPAPTRPGPALSEPALALLGGPGLGPGLGQLGLAQPPLDAAPGSAVKPADHPPASRGRSFGAAARHDFASATSSASAPQASSRANASDRSARSAFR